MPKALVNLPDHGWRCAAETDGPGFRELLGSFLTGVTIVATLDDNDQACAFTANSFTSVSLDPPLVLVCLGRNAASYATFKSTDRFSISLLGEWQKDISGTFARPGPSKDAALASLPDFDPPFVPGSLATMICESRQCVEAGDHIVLIGEIIQSRKGAGRPLGFFRGGYVSFGLAERPLEQMRAGLSVGGLLQQDNRVLLWRRPGSEGFEVPEAELRSGQRHEEALKALFQFMGIEARTSFVYALHQGEEARTTMIYTVETSDRVPDKFQLEDGTEIALMGNETAPWNVVHDEMNSDMLRRFFKERAAGCVGLYCDAVEGGSVASVSSDTHHWTEWHPNTNKI